MELTSVVARASIGSPELF